MSLEITYLSENSVTIVGKNDTTHWVEEHLEHTLWSESSSNDISDSLLKNKNRLENKISNLKLTLAALMLAS